MLEAESCWEEKTSQTQAVSSTPQLRYQTCDCCCCSVASVVSDSARPHRRQPTRLRRPWDSPGKNTGVGCHFLLQCMKVKSESEFAQSCLTLRDPMDCSPPGSSVYGIFQARGLEWGAIAFSKTCNWDRLKYPLIAQFSVEGRDINYLSWYFLDLKNHPVEPRQSKKSWKQYITFVLCH